MKIIPNSGQVVPQVVYVSLLQANIKTRTQALSEMIFSESFNGKLH